MASREELRDGAMDVADAFDMKKKQAQETGRMNAIAGAEGLAYGLRVLSWLYDFGIDMAVRQAVQIMTRGDTDVSMDDLRTIVESAETLSDHMKNNFARPVMIVYVPYQIKDSLN